MRIAGIALTLGLAAGLQAAEPVRVVIVTGANVHDWPKTTPLLQRIYEGSPRFKVVKVLEDPTKLDAATTDACDVVVSNWTKHPEMTGRFWGPDAEKALINGVRAGKGFVAFHAACAADHDWPEIQQLFGLTWKLNETGHTQYHPFKIEMTGVDHPITRGVPSFWIVDELYQNMWKQTPTDFAVLAQAFASPIWQGTGKYEPMLLVTSLGKGRGVNLLPGHDVGSMANLGFQTLLLRSTEWAARGEVTVPVPWNFPTSFAAAVTTGIDSQSAVKQAAAYTFGADRKPLFVVEQLITALSSWGQRAAEDRARLADMLASALGSDAAPEAKVFLVTQLGLIGTREHAKSVTPLLADERTADAARKALQQMGAAPATRPGEQAGKRDLRWEQNDDAVALLSGDKPVWRFNFGKAFPKACFHPLALADGTELTAFKPPDHAWHYALWFSWKDLNGVSYWEDNEKAPGRTEIVDIAVDRHDDHAADIRMKLQYRLAGGAVVLREERELRVSPPDGSGGYTIDWRSTFKPESGDVLLKGGVHGGGYSGLCIRMAQNSRDWELTASEGRREVPTPGQMFDKSIHGHRARWVSFSLVGEATGRRAGLAVLDHPSNLRHPAEWHCVFDANVPFGYFNPAPLYSEPYTLEAGKALALKYRLLIHAGLPENQLERAWQAFAQASR